MWRIGIALSCAVLLGPVARGAGGWQASVPSVAKDSKPWIALIDHLLERKMYYGALAASARSVVFFTDLDAKQKAYKTMVALVDMGFPFPVESYFMPGDIQPTDDDPFFAATYNLYKGILNLKLGMQRWADVYFASIDPDKFPKYLFYQALQTYAKGDLAKAEELLKKILSNDPGMPDQLPFTRKVARTLARVYFDGEKYDQSLDIYQNFLLKLNPIIPSDWIETAWDLYHLKRYQDALGHLYNMESRAAGDSVSLEKYTIRALVYRELCAVSNSESLIQSFDHDFGTVIRGLKRGESPRRYPILARIDLPENTPFVQLRQTYLELRKEAPLIRHLSGEDQSIANYLYASEERMIAQRLKSYAEDALQRSAQALVMLGESLKFLKYDVARNKFNPDIVFRPEEQTHHPALEKSENSYTIRWIQLGDYWRDERVVYQGDLPNRCSE